MFAETGMAHKTSGWDNRVSECRFNKRSEGIKESAFDIFGWFFISVFSAHLIPPLLYSGRKIWLLTTFEFYIKYTQPPRKSPITVQKSLGQELPKAKAIII